MCSGDKMAKNSEEILERIKRREYFWTISCVQKTIRLYKV
jgi:hypothetical protein